MSRTIPYNALAIPELPPTLSEITPQFEAMRRLELPGILIPDAGTDEITAMATLNPILAEYGLTIHETIPPIWHREGQGDQLLHIDSIPYDDDSVGMVVQCTGIGSADIILAKLAEPFCEELRQRNANRNPKHYNYDLPPGTDALLDEGLVDPEVLRPDIYIGSVATGGAIMFTFGGPHPIAHRFRTTTPVRHAQGYIIPFDRLQAADS